MNTFPKPTLDALRARFGVITPVSTHTVNNGMKVYTFTRSSGPAKIEHADLAVVSWNDGRTQLFVSDTPETRGNKILDTAPVPFEI